MKLHPAETKSVHESLRNGWWLCEWEWKPSWYKNIQKFLLYIAVWVVMLVGAFQNNFYDTGELQWFKYKDLPYSWMWMDWLRAPAGAKKYFIMCLHSSESLQISWRVFFKVFLQRTLAVWLNQCHHQCVCLLHVGSLTSSSSRCTTPLSWCFVSPSRYCLVLYGVVWCWIVLYGIVVIVLSCHPDPSLLFLRFHLSTPMPKLHFRTRFSHSCLARKPKCWSYIYLALTQWPYQKRGLKIYWWTLGDRHIYQWYGQGTKWAITVFIRSFTALNPEH